MSISNPNRSNGSNLLSLPVLDNTQFTMPTFSNVSTYTPPALIGGNQVSANASNNLNTHIAVPTVQHAMVSISDGTDGLSDYARYRQRVKWVAIPIIVLMLIGSMVLVGTDHITLGVSLGFLAIGLGGAAAYMSYYRPCYQ